MQALLDAGFAVETARQETAYRQMSSAVEAATATADMDTAMSDSGAAKEVVGVRGDDSVAPVLVQMTGKPTVRRVIAVPKGVLLMELKSAEKMTDAMATLRH